MCKKVTKCKYSPKYLRFVLNQLLHTQRPKQTPLECLYEIIMFYIDTWCCHVDAALLMLPCTNGFCSPSDTWKCGCPEDMKCCRLSMFVWEFVCKCACPFVRIWERTSQRARRRKSERDLLCSLNSGMFVLLSVCVMPWDISELTAAMLWTPANEMSDTRGQDTDLSLSVSEYQHSPPAR